jgi:acyl carrier protein
MEQLIFELCEILEVSELPLDSPFTSMPEWDSLNALGIISLLDSYGMQMSAEQVEKYLTIREFIDYVIAIRR